MKSCLGACSDDNSAEIIVENVLADCVIAEACVYGAIYLPSVPGRFVSRFCSDIMSLLYSTSKHDGDGDGDGG